jgi:membrane protein DedA with SNARE-associated domain
VHVLASWVTILRDSANPWAYPAVFLAAMAEAALFVGLLFPGETLLLFAGFLAWKGAIDVWIAIAVAIAGAILGDSVGYEIGRHGGPALRSSRLGRRIPEQRWARSERYLRERGGKAVFVGRFITGPKAVVPALAGEAHMPYRTFLAWNASSAVLWGTFHVGLGYVVGPSWEAVDRYLKYGGLVLLALAVVGGGTYLLIRRHRNRARPREHAG